MMVIIEEDMIVERGEREKGWVGVKEVQGIR